MFVLRNVKRFREHPWTLEGSVPKKNWMPAKELSTEKRLGKPAEPLSHGNDAWINATRMEESLFLSDGWLSTSTGSSISMKALQQEEAL